MTDQFICLKNENTKKEQDFDDTPLPANNSNTVNNSNALPSTSHSLFFNGTDFDQQKYSKLQLFWDDQCDKSYFNKPSTELYSKFRQILECDLEEEYYKASANNLVALWKRDSLLFIKK